MTYLSKSLIYVGGYHLVSSLTLYFLIRLISYQEFSNQYSLGGIDAIFKVTEGNYNFGLILSLIFAIAAILKGLELEHSNKVISKTRQLFNGVLLVVVSFFAIYFTFVNLLILINPSYF